MWRDVRSSRALGSTLGLIVGLSILAVALPGPARAAMAITITAVQDSGLDADRDGLFDVIQFNVTLDTDAAGIVYALAWINGTQPGQNLTSVAVGSQVIQVWFWGWELYNAGIDGPYAVKIQIRDYPSYATLNETWVTTQGYSHTGFDPPGALVTSLGSDWAVDTNGNGLYDELRFNYTLNVIDPNTYTIRGELWTFSPIAAVSEDLPLSTGTTSGTFILPGGLVNVSRQDGPYQFVLTALTPIHYSGTLPSSSESVATRAYTWTSFDPPYVRFGAPLTDEGRDLDADGLFDEIVVHVPLHLDQSATVTLSGSFVDPSLNLFDNIRPQLLLGGDVTLNLTFPTYELYARTINGPYSINVNFQVTELGYWGQQRTYVTAPYVYTQFSPPSVSLAAPAVSTVEDVDGNGLYDSLGMNVTLNVLRTGNYFTDGRLFVGSQSAEDAHYRHLAAGMANVSFRFSGIALNRTGQDGPWLAYAWITRLDGLPGDRITASATTPAYLRSQFESRDPMKLNGTIRSTTTGKGIPFVTLVARDPSHDFWTWTQTDGSGRYSLSLYNASWLLVMNPGATPDQPVAVPITVSGPYIENLNLEPMPTSRVRWTADVAQWNMSIVDHTRTYAVANQTIRFLADYFGNRDGEIADASELAMWSTYPASLPYPNPVRFSSTSALTMSVDDASLLVAAESVTSIAGVGSLIQDTPIGVSLRTSLQDFAPTVPGPQHHVKVSIPYDQPNFDTNLTLTLPPGISTSTAATSNVSFFQTSPRSWIIDPLGIPSLATPFATAWINSTLTPDTEVPVVRISGALTAERGNPVTFDGYGSTDNVGVTNYSWFLTLNGTTRLGYGPTFTTTFSSIGTYSVLLTVRDAAGNSNSTQHAITILDTRPPPAPTGLVSQVQDIGGSPQVQLSWSAVSADDLAGYIVYRSSDGGTTFARVTASPVASASYVDRAVTPGARYAYQVTAIDRYGNEGLRSTIVPADVPVTSPGPGLLDVRLAAGIAGVGVGIVVLAVAVARWRKSRRRPPPEG